MKLQDHRKKHHRKENPVPRENYNELKEQFGELQARLRQLEEQMKGNEDCGLLDTDEGLEHNTDAYGKYRQSSKPDGHQEYQLDDEEAHSYVENHNQFLTGYDEASLADEPLQDEDVVEDRVVHCC